MATAKINYLDEYFRKLGTPSNAGMIIRTVFNLHYHRHGTDRISVTNNNANNSNHDLYKVSVGNGRYLVRRESGTNFADISIQLANSLNGWLATLP